MSSNAPGYYGRFLGEFQLFLEFFFFPGYKGKSHTGGAFMVRGSRKIALLAILALTVLGGCGDDDPTKIEEKTCHGIILGEIVPTDETGAIAGTGGEDQWCYPGNGADPFLPQLYPAVPNPFYPVTRLTWNLPDAARLYLRILDEDCRLVRTLLDQDYFAGTAAVQWDCTDDQDELVPDGDYVAVLTADGHTCAGILRVHSDR
jgi:FlgD Ig-like domain